MSNASKKGAEGGSTKREVETRTLVEFTHGELGVVHIVNTFVTVHFTNLKDSLHTSDDELLVKGEVGVEGMKNDEKWM